MHRRVAPRGSLVLFFYYATFTRENNARAHFTRVICSPGCPRPPPSPLFVARCTGEKEEDRGGGGRWGGGAVAPKACQSTCPTLTSLSELKRTLLTRRSHFVPHRPPKPTSTPRSHHPTLFADISARLPFISSSSHETLTCWQTDAHIHMPTNDKNTHRTSQHYFFFHKGSSIVISS